MSRTRYTIAELRRLADKAHRTTQGNPGRDTLTGWSDEYSQGVRDALLYLSGDDMTPRLRVAFSRRPPVVIELYAAVGEQWGPEPIYSGSPIEVHRTFRPGRYEGVGANRGGETADVVVTVTDAASFARWTDEGGAA
jgi:hypothetical protein